MSSLYIATISAARSWFVVEASGVLDNIMPEIDIPLQASTDRLHTDALGGNEIDVLDEIRGADNSWHSQLHQELASRIAALGWACACSERLRWPRSAAGPLDPIEDEDDVGGFDNPAANQPSLLRSIGTYDKRYLFIVMSALLHLLNARAASTRPLLFRSSSLRPAKLIVLTTALDIATGVVDEIVHFFSANIFGPTSVLEVHGRQPHRVDPDDVCMFCLDGCESAATSASSSTTDLFANILPASLTKRSEPTALILRDNVIKTNSLSSTLECFCDIDSHLAHPKCMRRWYSLAMSGAVGRRVPLQNNARPINQTTASNEPNCPLCFGKLRIEVFDARTLLRRHGFIRGMISVAMRTVRWKHVLVRIAITTAFTTGVLGLFLLKVTALTAAVRQPRIHTILYPAWPSH